MFISHSFKSWQYFPPQKKTTGKTAPQEGRVVPNPPFFLSLAPADSTARAPSAAPTPAPSATDRWVARGVRPDPRRPKRSSRPSSRGLFQVIETVVGWWLDGWMDVDEVGIHHVMKGAWRALPFNLYRLHCPRGCHDCCLIHDFQNQPLRKVVNKYLENATATCTHLTPMTLSNKSHCPIPSSPTNLTPFQVPIDRHVSDV